LCFHRLQVFLWTRTGRKARRSLQGTSTGERSCREREARKGQMEQEEDREERERCRRDFLYFAEKWLWIVNRKRSLQTFVFNPVQRRYHDEKTRFDIVLKARKVGISTYKGAEFFHETIFVPNTTTTVVAHDLDTTAELFERVKLFFERLPDFLKPKIKRNNRRELVFTETASGEELNSRYSVGTAGNYEFGRGKDIDNLHLSEYAFFPKQEKIKMGAMQALREGGKICIESTANGFNDFRDEWERATHGESRFKAHFFPWHSDATYRAEILPGETLDLSQEEKALSEAYGLSPEQIQWMRERKRELRGKFPQEFPANDMEAFLSSGRPVFDMKRLTELLIAVEGRKPLEVGDSGQLKKWRKPVSGREYIAGADCAEGLAQGDYDCCVVLDKETWEEVAELHGRWPPHVFARKCQALCKEYNEATLAVERNNHGHSVLNTLRNQLHYPHLYHYRSYDQGGSRMVLGWETNSRSKPVMIDGLDEAIREGLIVTHEEGFVRECLTYVFDDKGGTGAQRGCHDDRVIARAIGLQAAKSAEGGCNMSYIRGT
jgi:hypothetical protein